jgi:transposase
MIMTSALPIGIDVSKDQVDIFLTWQGESFQLEFSNDQQGFRQFRKWLKKRKITQAHLCMEATGRYADALARFFYEAGYEVSVVNPRRIKAYADSKLRRNKTDTADARIIEDFCRSQQPPLWQPPAPEVEALQMMTRHLDRLKRMRTQEINRLKSGISEPTVRAMIQEHIAYLDRAIQELEAKIQDHIDQHPELKTSAELLQTIPGIGESTAAILLAEIQDIDRFDQASELAAYAGLSPRRRRSGSSVRGASHLSKMGNAVLRRALYFPALSASRFNPGVRTLTERLAARGKQRGVIQGAAMRKLLHIIFGVWKHRRPFNPALAMAGTAS